jgi:ribulose-5-phosphate 4-epimerase/fuculose-1-phosphate aldolase
MSMPGWSQTLHSNLDHEEARVDLACAFRWTARLNMHEGIANHFSYALSDDGARFLMNPNGRHFSRIKASELLLIDANDPATMDRPDAPDPTAWGLHGAIHRQVPQARCLMHVHSKYATVLASLADSTLPPIDQNSMRFHNRMAVDDGYDGMGLGDEAERVATLIGDKPILVMGNHGVMVVGETIGQTFDELYYFERACETYITALTTGRPLRIASNEVAEKTMRQWVGYPQFADMHLTELKAILDDEEPDYRL